jgi:peroxiredoxin
MIGGFMLIRFFEKALDFSMAESSGKTVSLSDFRGRWVVLFLRKQWHKVKVSGYADTVFETLRRLANSS